MHKTVYNAENSLDAHMVLDMLKQAHIHGHLEGEYLQGGMGELPATGLVKVVVDEDDYELAHSIIDKWQTEQPADFEEQQKCGEPLVYFVAGVFVGGLLTFLIML